MTKIPRILRGDIAFIFIDLQESLLKLIPDSDLIVARNCLLMDAAKTLQVSFFATTQYKKGLGDLHPPIAHRAGKEAPDKNTFSCYETPAIAGQLQSLRKPWIGVCGIETHICVLQTTLDLLQSGYQVAVVTDAVGARREKDHEAGLTRLEKSGALLVTAEMLIYEMLGRSDNQEFRKILPLIKGQEVSG